MLSFSAVSWTPEPQVAVLNEISLNIQEGEFCCLVGPSGAGKTSLLKLAAGILSPTSGEVLIDGMHPEQSRDKLSYVFQSPVLFPWRTVLENLLLPMDVCGRPRCRNAARECLNQVRLEGVEDLYPRQLSGGMQSRVAIARALITDPTILLMDEPFADLDEVNREHLNLELLRVWMEKKRTVLFVTHDLSEAVFLADRVIVLSSKPGRVFADIKIELPRPRSESIYDLELFDRQLKEVRQALRAATKHRQEAQ